MSSAPQLTTDVEKFRFVIAVPHPAIEDKELVIVDVMTLIGARRTLSKYLLHGNKPQRSRAISGFNMIVDYLLTTGRFPVVDKPLAILNHKGEKHESSGAAPSILSPESGGGDNPEPEQGGNGRVLPESDE